MTRTHHTPNRHGVVRPRTTETMMGYARYERNGIVGGYAVADTCNLDGCDTEIDRGMAYLCGDEPGGGGLVGCGKWFCANHLYYSPVTKWEGHVCETCSEQFDDA